MIIFVSEPYYSYSRRDYVVIVATDEKGDYLCVRQFRHGIKQVTTEFPAGGIERKDGKEYGKSGDASAEDALEAAKRELLEETGYVSDNWRFLLRVPSNATIADNYAYLFEAKDCHKVSKQELDETEFLNITKLSEKEIESMIGKGSLADDEKKMKILAMTFRLHAPWVNSLKEKRMIVKSLIAKLQNKFHVSAAEVDKQDTHHIIVIGVAAIVPHNAIADSIMDDITDFIEDNTEAEILDETREIR